MMQSGFSPATLKRLPIYLNYLEALPKSGPANISATAIATALGLGEVQVRKDLGAVSGEGKPRIGYIVHELIERLKDFLGYNDTNDAVIVGAGKLGRALLEYSGFQNYGLNIVAAFDANEALEGKTDSGKCVFPMEKFDNLCQRLNIRIGIITVPAGAAQKVCDSMVRNGIKAIWNFAPTHLAVPGDILVQNENMAASLAVLSGHLTERMNAEQ